MNEERMTILNMIAQKTITPEEGEKLLRALEEGDEKKHSRKPFSHEEPFPGSGGDPGKDWEKGFDNFMDGFGLKMEKFVENFGDEFGEKAEMMAQDLASNLGGLFNGFTGDFGENKESYMTFPGIPEWGLESGFRGELLDFSQGTIDMNGVKGLLLFTPFVKRKKGGGDVFVTSGTGDKCLFDKENFVSAVKKDGWILFSFFDEAVLTVPDSLAKLAVISSRGDINVNVPGSELYLRTLLGDISLQGAGESLKAVSMKGDIKFKLSEPYAGTADISTMMGDVFCKISLPQNLDFTAKTIKGDLDASGTGVELKGQFQKPANNFVTGVIGKGGEGSLLLNTMKGDISLTTVV